MTSPPNRPEHLFVWLTPPLHRLAVPGGAVHDLDHLSFLAFGALIWLGAFDSREPRPLRQGIRDGGLPWWARHAYAMSARAAMLPPALVLWIVPGYHVADERPLGTRAPPTRQMPPGS